MAVGRISGPLLKANLLRDGVNLAFETDLLFLDVVNGRIGIKTASPQYTLDVNGTTRTTNLQTTTQANIASFTFSTNTIASTNSIISLEPSGSNSVVYQSKVLVNNNLQLYTNSIQTTTTNSDLEIRTNGTGQVNINSNVYVTGNVHATGNITADGNITIGDANTDGVTFNADITSNIIPDVTNFYDLGSDPTASGKAWKTSYITDVKTTNITTAGITANGVNLVLPQGNIRYVATTGSDSNAGVHEHNPYLTLKYALSQAQSGDTIVIYPGTYSEIFPLTIPQGVTVKGTGVRAVNITPTVGTIDKDAFLLNGEVTIEDLTISGFRFNSTNNTGYGFRFASNFLVTTRSPYIRNVTVITKGSTTSTADPYGFDSNDAGKGALLDGSVANVNSKEATGLFHSVTFITPNQETLIATNGVRIEWLNSFTYFADIGIYAYSGTTGFAGAGQTRLRIDTRTGTWATGNTVTYYDTNGTTVLGTGTIASITGNYVNLTGKCIGFQTISNRTSKLIYPSGNASLSTAQKKFGTASLALDGTGDFITVASQPDFEFGTGDFCVEMWIYRTGSPGVNQILADFRSSTPQIVPTFYLSTTYYPSLVVNGATVITGTTAAALNTWTHVALSKSGTSTKIFINGTQTGSTYTDTNTYVQGPVTIGARFDNTTAFFGYIDDVRISKGVPRYTSTFTVPAAALSGDLSTVLLLHFNGTNGSTTILDDGVTLQDLRTSAGGTATIINHADYSDFAAEIRAIGSANIYGNYGIKGDGDGVVIYLISHNLSYVGSGKSSINNPSERIDANEITKLNRAKIYFSYVDNDGNFNVGDKFSVNQKTGDVTFNGQTVNVTSLTGVTFTDGTHTTSVTAQEIDTGNLRISGNTIESITGDVNVTAASGAINLQNNTYVSGNLDVTGNVTIGGNITIGDQTTDTVSFIAGINSDLIPSTTATYNLGTTSLRWNNAYLSRVEIDNLVIDSNTISTTNANDDLQLIANGTGRIYIPSSSVQIDQNLTVTNNLTVTTGTTYLKSAGVTGTITQTGDINQTGNFTTSGNTSVTGNITGTGYLQLPQITISGNTVQTTVTDTDLELQANGTGNVIIEGIKVQDNIIQSIVANSNITLTPQGTGGVIINSTQSLQIPVGTTAQRPGTPTNGMVRYNTSLLRYEGYNNGYWLQLSGVIDNSGNTRILAEATPGANDNILYFYANNNLTATIDSTKLFTQRLQTSNLDINNNTISSITTNSDINLTATGTGRIRFGNLAVSSNTIANIVTDAITDFSQAGTGYVKFSGTYGVVIPSGNTATDRPPVTETGMIRFNTVDKGVEVFNGISWGSVAGSANGVSASTANDIGLASALIFG